MDMQRSPASAEAHQATLLQRRLTDRWPSSKTYTRVGKTRLCIDGPPRSANSLLVHKVRLANASYLRGAGELSHHTHDPDSLLLALIAGLPVIFPLRNASEAIASAVVYEGNGQWEQACKRYLSLCEIALSRRNSVLIAPFDVVVNDANAVFRAANAHFGLQLGMLPMDDGEANAAITAKVEANARKLHGNAWDAKVGIPRADRAGAKADIARRLAAEPLYDRCRKIHERLSSIADVARFS